MRQYDDGDTKSEQNEPSEEWIDEDYTFLATNEPKQWTQDNLHLHFLVFLLYA
jgi:hypothetical protein